MMTKNKYSDAANFNTVTDNGVAWFFDARCEQSQLPLRHKLRKKSQFFIEFPLICPLVTDYAIK
jgi:hypothetical protein